MSPSRSDRSLNTPDHPHGSSGWGEAPLVLLPLLLFVLAACQGDDQGQQAAPTTTVAPTTTTKPDPAVAGCKQFRDDPFEAMNLLVLSRDNRIVEAAKAYRDATELGEGPTGEFAKAVQEIVEACVAAGYEL